MRSTTTDPVGAEAALELLEGVTDLYVARGKKVIHFDVRERTPAMDDEVLAVILGRSGTLRAPALRMGTTVYVGYNADILALIR